MFTISTANVYSLSQISKNLIRPHQKIIRFSGGFEILKLMRQVFYLIFLSRLKFDAAVFLFILDFGPIKRLDAPLNHWLSYSEKREAAGFLFYFAENFLMRRIFLFMEGE